MRDVKYLHKSCNTKKSIHKMRNATSCIFFLLGFFFFLSFHNRLVHNMRTEKEKIRLHKSIFIYFFILLFFPLPFHSGSLTAVLYFGGWETEGGKVLCFVLFTE